MTTVQKKKILIKIQQLESDIATLEKARLEIGVSGYASATLASAGGSRSYTRLDISKLTELIGQMSAELRGLRNMLKGEACSGIKTIATIYV